MLLTLQYTLSMCPQKACGMIVVQYDPCKGAGVPLDLLAGLAGVRFYGGLHVGLKGEEVGGSSA